MLDLTDLARARCVVELGAGTGVYTGEILARLRPDARLLAFEIDPHLADTLPALFPDPRLRVVNDSAENVRAYLDGARADVIVSGLPFTSLPAALRKNILDQSAQALTPNGVMLVLQYSPLIQRELRRMFASVRRRVSLLNVPPAFLFACETVRVRSGRGER
jgi:phospholipid N-methyltransferase